MKQIKIGFYAILLLTGLALTKTSSAQKGPTCDSAKVLTYPINNTVTSYTNDVYWFKVTLDAGDYNINLTNYPGVGKITKAGVYIGSCPSLTLTSTDSLASPTDTTFNINIHNTINGTAFYIKLYNRGGSITFNAVMATNVKIVGQIGFCPGQQVALSAYPVNPNGTQTYTWQPGGANTGAITVTPSSTVSPTTYTLTYRDNGGTLTTIVSIFPLSPNECKNCEQVQNGHFEWYDAYSTGFSNSADSYFWHFANTGTSDYFNANFIPVVGVPTSFNAFNTPAHSGKGYAGFFTFGAVDPNSREYIQSPLTCTLVPGQLYNVSFYTILGNKSYLASNNIGAYLSSTPVYNPNTSPLSYTPQINRATPLNYSPTNTWTQLSGTITGNNEQFITIGNFYSGVNTTTVLSTSTYSLLGSVNTSYYLVDDVSVTPLTPTLSSSTNTVNCNSASTITLTATGSSSVYTTWTDGITTYSGSVVTVPTPTTTKTYTCNVNLPCASCSTISQTLTVTFVPNMTLTASASPTNVCVGQTTTLTASGATTYSWSPVGATTATTTVTQGITSTYTVTGTTGICAYTKTVQVNIKPQYCCQSASFSIGTATANTNYSNTSNGAGAVVDVLGTITFTANSTMSNYILRMAPTATIHINPNVTVTFSNCTLYSCTDLWGGILIQDAVGTPGIVNVINSRIEDMYMGITHAGTHSLTTTSANNYINIQNSVLNKNYIAVHVRNSPVIKSTGAIHGLSVTGSTISSVYSTTSPQTTLKTSTVYAYAYNNIYNTAVSYTNFPRGAVGIYLYNLAEAPVIIGDSTGTGGTNRFENLDFGVYAENASPKVFNNHFINITGSSKQFQSSFPPPPPPAGPAEIGVAVNAVITLTVNNPYWVRVGKVSSSTPTGGNPFPGGNKFENCGKGIAITNYNEPVVKGNYFSTTTTSVPPSITPSELYSYYQSQNGVYIKDIKANATVVNNYILNHRSGIYTSHNIDASLGLSAFVKVENNSVQVSGSTGFCMQAIQVDQPASTTNLGTGLLTVKNNTIQNVYRGVWASNVKAGLQINDNPTISIDVAKMYGITGSSSTQINNYERTGIRLDNCVDGVVANNPNITGVGTIYSSYYIPVKGIWIRTSGGTNAQVNCNTISNMGRCMQFNNTSLNKVAKNVMNGTYQGFVLSASGVIGTQGSASLTNDNEWHGFTGGAAQYAETYTDGTNNANVLAGGSVQFVKPGSPYEPTQHYSSNGNPYITGALQGIRTQSLSTPGESCLSLRVMGGENSSTESNAMRMASANDTTNTGLYEALASDTTFYDVYQNEMQYRNKQLVYELLNKQSIDTTKTLNEFYSANQNSNYQTLISVNEAIAVQDYQTAQSINSGMTTNNTIEEYQKRVNELLLKYLSYQSPVNTTLSLIPILHTYSALNEEEIAELKTIANSCLDQYGNVVTQARVLVNNVSNTLVEFDENCNPEYNQRKGNTNKATVTLNDRIKSNVLPNPNNGNFILQYDLGKYSNADLMIYDITGKLMLKESLTNTEKQINMNVDKFENGIYYYTIRTNKELLATNKFVIIK